MNIYSGCCHNMVNFHEAGVYHREARPLSAGSCHTPHTASNSTQLEPFRTCLLIARLDKDTVADSFVRPVAPCQRRDSVAARIFLPVLYQRKSPAAPACTTNHLDEFRPRVPFFMSLSRTCFVTVSPPSSTCTKRHNGEVAADYGNLGYVLARGRYGQRSSINCGSLFFDNTESWTIDTFANIEGCGTKSR